MKHVNSAGAEAEPQWESGSLGFFLGGDSDVSAANEEHLVLSVPVGRRRLTKGSRAVDDASFFVFSSYAA